MKFFSKRGFFSQVVLFSSDIDFVKFKFGRQVRVHICMSLLLSEGKAGNVCLKGLTFARGQMFVFCIRSFLFVSSSCTHLKKGV